MGGVDRIEFWEEEGRERERAARHEVTRSDMLNLSRKPQPCGDLQIIRNGLNQDVRANKRLEIMARQCLNEYNLCAVISGYKRAGQLGAGQDACTSYYRVAPGLLDGNVDLLCAWNCEGLRSTKWL